MIIQGRATDSRDKGFTLIELLVVIIIVGILAAIAIPVFLNQRKKGVDASLKSDLKARVMWLEGNPEATESSPRRTPGNDFVRERFVVYGADIDGDGYSYPVVYCLQVKSPGGSDPTTGLFWDSEAGGLQPAGTTSCPSANAANFPNGYTTP